MFLTMILLALALALYFSLRALNNFVPGHFAPIAWQASGAAASTTLQIRDHNVELETLLHDVTHTGTSGVRARIAGPLDAQGSVNATLDLDAPPYGAVSLFPGTKGICAFGFTTTRSLQLPVRVAKLKFMTAVDKEVAYGFDVKMDALAGVVVYPAL